MAQFNTTAYSATSAAYNALAPVYIDGTVAAVSASGTSATGLAAYGGSFGNVMCSFMVDNGDSIFGGNVIVPQSVNVAGNLVAITAAATVVYNPYSLYYPIPTVTVTAFQALLALKVPWGQYSAANWSGNTLSDLTGHGHYATTSGVTSGTTSGNGATGVIRALNGTITSTILWPAGSIPAAYTICSITSYTNSATNQQRILCSSSNNWLHGHHANKRGCAYNGSSWRTAQVSIGTLMNWVNVCATSSSTAPSNVLVDGVAVGLAVGGGGSVGTLCINLPPNVGEVSDFGFSQLIIWDQVLSATELATVSAALATYLATGVLQ